MHGIDLELVEAMLRAFTVVHDLEETPDPTVEGVTLDSADGRYRIELKVEGPEQAALRALLLDLMGEDPLGFSRLLEAVRWEMPSELEEAALRFRWARLADLGISRPRGRRRPLRGGASAVAAAVAPPRRSWSGAAGRRLDFVQAALEGLDAVEAENAARSCAASSTPRWSPMAPTPVTWTRSVPRPSGRGTRSASGSST